MAKTKATAEFGDFQTPRRLADEICALLSKLGVNPASLIEPTCGLGNFVFAGLDQFCLQRALGSDINPNYIQFAQAFLKQHPKADRASFIESDFFHTDWEHVLGEFSEPILLLGNLPWVTNAHLTTLGSQNLPVKSNFQRRNGLEAITGKANFDISEWMLIRLLEATRGRRGTLAMLCKSSVARRTLHHAWKTGIDVSNAEIYGISAGLHFDAAVDAALLAFDFSPGARTHEASVYLSLDAATHSAIIGYEDEQLIADVGAYRRLRHLCGNEILKWRSGIKHDCSKVMELSREGAVYRNGLGELVEIEDEFLYPMLKSSGVANYEADQKRRWMIVTQRAIGEGTDTIRTTAPKTWAYLESHADLLGSRGSSIYRNRPRFSMFGIGAYSFAPWKVAISGFYKKFAFVTLGPIEGKPVVLDDTSYFLPFESQRQAEFVASLLNSSVARSFLCAFVFWDSKRPITAELLRRLDVRRLAGELNRADEFEELFGLSPGTESKGRSASRKPRRPTLTLWPE